MSKSLIRKNQLHPDISDLVGQYGSGFFITSGDLANYQFTAQLTGENVVYTTGNQTISGIKTFTDRPNVNGTDFLLSGELPNTIVYISGDQTISGIKTFTERPFFNNSGFATTGDLQFNGFRPITANVNGFQGVTPSGDNIITFLNNVFYPFIPASINLNSFSTQELGTTTITIPFIGTINTGSLNLNQITNVEGFVNNIGRIPLLIPVVQNFNWSVGVNLNVTSNNIYVKASGVNQNNTPIQIQSNTRSIIFEAPSYAGSGIDNLQNNPGAMKTALSTSQQGTNNGKLVIQKPSSIQMQVYTNNNWFYFVYPDSWGALSNISNPQLGNFSISTDFVTGAVTLTLANGSSHSYRYYKRSLPTTLTNYPVIYTF
jgi:hypothetical protein